MRNDLAAKAEDDQPGADDERALSELVAARICHDLVSPVGAIGNAVDLARELGGAGVEDMDMIAASAARAAAILKLHRLAFGPQAADGEPHDRRALAGSFENALSARRIELVVTGADGPPLPSAVARLAALTVMAGRALVGTEGRVALVLAPEGPLPLAVTAEGRQAGWPPELEALVRERARPELPRQVEFALLPRAARAAGARLESTAAPERAGLRAAAG
jgi:histidine phosphotransferase ChpT